MKFKTLILFIFIFSVPLLITAQRVSNVRAETEGDYVNIRYDLEGKDASDLYRIELYASQNNYSQPLRMVSGDVGENINPGSNKLITWRPYEELQNFQGDITFEVRATVMGSYYRITSPTSSGKFKKGNSLTIRWEGGNSSENVKIELLRLNNKVNTITDNTNNNGSFSWTIPKSMKAGKGFKVRVADTGNQANQGVSQNFRISGGIPPIVLIGAPVLLGGVVAVLLLGNSPTEKKDSLPLPPDAPTE